MKLKALSPEIYYACEPIRHFSAQDIQDLHAKARELPGGKLRICLHLDPGELLHEMLIALRKDVRYPEHMHTDSDETYNILYGHATVRIYDDRGAVVRTIPLGTLEGGRARYIRIPRGTYHSVTIESDVLIFLETKLGPFRPEANFTAPFATVHTASASPSNPPSGKSKP